MQYGYIHACAVASTTNMRLYKNGMLVGTGPASLPRYRYRGRMFLGESVWTLNDANFAGAVCFNCALLMALCCSGQELILVALFALTRWMTYGFTTMP